MKKFTTIYANDGLSTQQTLEEFIKILFIKVIDEKERKQFYVDDTEFEQIKSSKKSEELHQRINNLFSTTLKNIQTI